MKKILIFTLMFVAVTASAQVETMIKKITEPDPMKETKGSVVWVCQHMAMGVEDDVAVIVLFCKDHVFVDEPFRVGFYDENDSLRVFVRSWHATIEQGSQSATLVASGFSNDSIPGAERVDGRLGKYLIPTKAFIDYVTTHKGKIRVLGTAFGGNEYELLAVLKKE